jgi:hypothetical protein
VQLHRHREDIEAAGVRLAVIGQGRPEHAADFRRSQKVDIPLLVDRERESYRAAGAKVATFSELLGPRVIGTGLRRSLATGTRQGRTVGHPAQLGGTVIVTPDGSVPYAHLSEDASDYPPTAEILQAARRAAAGSA